jgi:glyoxylase-like metal-dependent hydrolase (beta-lactamase superfamily II)
MSHYSIWVVEYAWVAEQPTSIFIHGAHNQGCRKMPYGYVLLKGGGHTVLVDVGFNNAAYGAVLASTFKVTNWHPPDVVLRECGVSPADISSAFLTHAHFDHMGNMYAFPNATFYIQERELSKWVWTLTLGRRFRWMMGGVDPADILYAVDLATKGRLVAVDGDRQDVLPGIDLHAAYDTHTWASMYVRVRNDLAAQSNDAWILAGDLVYVQENLRGYDPADPQYMPVGFGTGNNFNLLMTTDEMVRHVKGEHARVIPVHEERLKDMYPSRITKTGLRVTEIALADGDSSRVR